VASEIDTEAISNRDSSVEGTPALKIEHTVGVDLDPRGARLPGEKSCGKRATRPVARTNERDSEQENLRAAAGHAAPEENPEQQKPYTHEHYLEQREPGERKRATLAGERAARLCTRRRERSLTSRGVDDGRRTVLILRSRRPTRPSHTGKRAEHRDHADRESKSEITGAPPQHSHTPPLR
jgi:hypothetical protein